MCIKERQSVEYLPMLEQMLNRKLLVLPRQIVIEGSTNMDLIIVNHNIFGV